MSSIPGHASQEASTPSIIVWCVGLRCRAAQPSHRKGGHGHPANRQGGIPGTWSERRSLMRIHRSLLLWPVCLLAVASAWAQPVTNPVVVTVSLGGTGAQFNNLTDALISINDASATKPHVILVYPGIYTDHRNGDNLTWKGYVSLRGADRDTTIIRGSPFTYQGTYPRFSTSRWRTRPAGPSTECSPSRSMAPGTSAPCASGAPRFDRWGLAAHARMSGTTSASRVPRSLSRARNSRPSSGGQQRCLTGSTPPPPGAYMRVAKVGTSSASGNRSSRRPTRPRGASSPSP